MDIAFILPVRLGLSVGICTIYWAGYEGQVLIITLCSFLRLTASLQAHIVSVLSQPTTNFYDRHSAYG
jgi:hypothetical protein